MTRMPASRALRTASATPGRGGASSPTRTARTRPRSAPPRPGRVLEPDETGQNESSLRALLVPALGKTAKREGQHAQSPLGHGGFGLAQVALRLGVAWGFAPVRG